MCMQGSDALMRAVTSGQDAVLDVALHMVEVLALVLCRVEYSTPEMLHEHLSTMQCLQCRYYAGICSCIAD